MQQLTFQITLTEAKMIACLFNDKKIVMKSC